ncbi:hypothetical protein P3T76_009936 [Phytophthora citrophthora]|uniref:Alpha-L-rhamnosidase six-hairpin glycosidase domain-containing protein n=1 Tax=Phytophthora citrophthora TaxID=4793 RepID=A0AAD9GEV1_9STRA|nr:hypothetical protein P3T76_009936 [Phytophthora citrophthora]
MRFWAISILASLATGAIISTSPWDSYIQSPASRDILPESIYRTSGNVTLSELNQLAATLSGNGSTVTFDFGRQVSGVITVHFGASTSSGSQLGIAFTENEQYIGITSDRATGPLVDGILFAPAEPGSIYTFSREFGRGGFRYLTVSTSSDAGVEVTGISTHFTAAPSTDDNKLRDYSGYFYSDDDLLNHIWYAGAYTVQLCEISASEARASPPAISSGWANNATIENVSADAEVFVDGAKRDRTPWPGDYGVATLSKAVSLNEDNLLSVRNALESIIDIQAPSGEFPYAGTPLGLGYQEAGTNSDTYHLWTIIALADYTMLSNDQGFLKDVWGQVQRGFEFTLAKVDTSDSLLNVTDLSDWGRVGQGGKNTAANSLLYHALVSYVQLADDLGLSELMYRGKSYSDIARDVKFAVNEKLWDESAGFFRDNTTTEFYPQDGNVLAVQFNVTESLERAATISQSLTTRWNEFGAVSPEALGSISPFMTSLEIDAHLRANPGNATLAMEIMRRQWSYMLHNFSNSTTIEAYYYTGELKYPFYEAVEKNLGSYISHAHAWSTGPTASLTLHIGGLTPLTAAGKAWSFIPHAAGSNVRQLQTGYTLATGKFLVDWTIGNNGSFFTATIVTPQNTTGSISVPTFGKALNSIEISINDNVIWANSASSWSGCGVASASVDYVTVSDVPNGGKFTIIAKDKGEIDGEVATALMAPKKKKGKDYLRHDIPPVDTVVEEDKLQKKLILARETGNWKMEAQSLMQLGQLMKWRGREEQGDTYQVQASAILRVHTFAEEDEQSD